MSNHFEDKSLFESIGTFFFIALGIGLVLGLFTPIIINFTNSILTVFDKNALIYVENKYEPFRVGIEMAFLGSFITFLIVTLFEYRNRRGK